MSLPWRSIAGLALCAVSAAAQTPQWETAANHPGDPKFVQMPYEVVFVATKVVETVENCCFDLDGNPNTPCTNVPLPQGQYEIGTDVADATKPSAGNSLWVVTRNGEVKKLFPLGVHENVWVTHPDTGQQTLLIDTPSGQLDKGSVVEPNVSEDGKRVTFGYFHDATFNVSSGEGGMSKRGADLYTVDMTSLLADPSTDPATLPVRRLTFKLYNADGSQSSADKNKYAMNPSVVNLGNNGWGTVEMHGVEMRTADGLKMVWVSGEKRLLNSNENYGHPNYNVNLKIADIKTDGSLGAARQFQYYTTTSALSPTPLPNGVAFSYQASTADGRNWHIQRLDSVGRWSPLIGYGSNDDLFHLGAYCVATQSYNGDPAGDFFIATRYYNLNNNGFGGMWKINLDETGINTYDDVTQWGIKPKQKSARRVSPLVTDNDFPSGKNSAGQFYGKMTSPRCGRPDELFFAHSPTSANGRLCSIEDGKDIYHAYIGFRAGFGTFDPTAVWSPTSNNGVRILVDDGANAYTLAWPVPLLSWQERTGDVKQAFSNSVIDRRSTILPGQPFAQVGTSAIYNTDRRPYDCWLGTFSGGQPYNPNHSAQAGVNGVNGNQRTQILQNFDAVTKVLHTGGAPDFCKALAKPDVLGIQVNITNNKINHDCCNLGYETDGAGRLETVRQLGVYDVRSQSDGSFQAVIPAHVPFEFHLLDAEYGMRLVDVRSWHSLQPRETRTNCGGCHQHVEGLAIPFAGTVASTQPPLDMVTQTQTVTYDGSCNPIVMASANATERMPEWKLDIWPGFNTYCGSCHTNGGSGTTTFNYTAGDEQSAYNTLRNKNFADSTSGALGSPAFWAARGERTDGRNNALYASTNPPYKFSAVHAATPGLCAQGDTVKAGWVHKLGQWIDSHMPRTTSGNFPVDKDTYHPTVDGAYSNAACDGTKLRVGYWDDSGFLKLVEVRKNGALIASWGPNQPNGSQLLTGQSITNTDLIRVLAEDADGNRQVYEKTGKQLKADCQWKFVLVEPQPIDPVPIPWP